MCGGLISSTEIQLRGMRPDAAMVSTMPRQKPSLYPELTDLRVDRHSHKQVVLKRPQIEPLTQHGMLSFDG